jgi:hypothetical protein
VTTIVQQGDDNTGYSGQASGVAFNVLPANTGTGHCVILNIVVYTTTLNAVASVSSPIGTFTRINSKEGSPYDAEQWVCLSSTGAAKAVTITTTGGLGFFAQAIELSAAGSSAYIGDAQYVGSGYTTISNTVVPEHTGDFIMSLCAWNGGSGSVTGYPSSPWAKYSSTDSAGTYSPWQIPSCAITTQFAPSTSTLTAAWTFSYSTGVVALALGIVFSSGYTVTFNNNGGTGSLTAETDSSPTALSLFSTGTMALAAFHFVGWNTVADGTGTAYADGATYAFSASATLYAQWAPDAGIIPVLM